MTTTVASEPGRSKGLHIGLWIVQVLLALSFTGAGLMKLTTPIADLAQKMPMAASSPGLIRFIGLAEVLGAIGVVLPAATRIKPQLTPLAAVGLLTIMVLATAFHISRGEISAIPAPIVLGSLAAFVAWGRTRKAPIAPRA
jgi:uncharacterized membrane protein YphA (DoxX/SURF4 family)